MNETDKKQTQVKVIDFDKVTFADAENMALNKKQFNYVMSKTPEAHLYKRPAKGGGEWTYVKGGYIKKVLNLAFGFDWDFEIKNYQFDLNVKQAFVHGRLTVRSGQKTIVKEQFGRVDIKFKTIEVLDFEGKKIWVAATQKRKGYYKRETTTEPLDLGNDLKAASTDALKKCASEIGICADIYAEDDFTQVRATDDEDFGEAVTPEVITKINSFEEESKLREYYMSYDNRKFAKDPEFERAVTSKLEELWQRQNQ